MSDEEIALKLKEKDVFVLEYIMQQYNKLLWAIIGNILSNCGTIEDIEDCISDVYVKLLEKSFLYNHTKGSFKSYLAKIGKHTAIDKYRMLTYKTNVELHVNNNLDYNDDLFQILLLRENKKIIIDEINNIKEPDREIIIRRYYFNEKVKTISVKMNLNTKYVENKLYQSKQRLKKALEKREDL